MTRPRLHLARDPFEPEFGKRGELRQPVGEFGRVHLDRWLPFIVLHRSSDPSRSIARRVAVNSPAYLVWSPSDDAVAQQAFSAIADAVQERFGCLMVVTVDDAPWKAMPEGSQKLPPFDFTISASGGANTRQAFDCLIDALRQMSIDLREPEVSVGDARPAPLDMEGCGRIDRLAVVIPQIHRGGENIFYPQLTHELAVAVGDALLKATCEFISASQAGPPPHYRSLGRSAFLAAALDADKRLDRVARSFDFLLSVSPINSREAMERFFGERRGHGAEVPVPAADGRSRRRQARFVRGRPVDPRGSSARAAAVGKAAGARPSADHACNAQHAGVSGGFAASLRHRRLAPSRRRAHDPRRHRPAAATEGRGSAHLKSRRPLGRWSRNTRR